ncbi:hypothetical protein H0H87_000170 [Tephrocybe sp. NHM501043]|nr:hypothetical protein H0H87_000170 [Tephrocybe sp. NHM501043]
MGTRFLVFESHLSFVLQFMCDFGLYGCGWIEVENVLQRDVRSAVDGDYSHLESDEHFPPSPYLRQTRMPLEVDAIAPNILNRRNITARNFHHKFQTSFESLPALPDAPLVLSVRELWEDERKRRIARGLDPTPTIPVDPSNSMRGPGCDWVAEAEYWDQIREKIEADREIPKLSTTNGWDNRVMTTFESIEALWDDRWRKWKPQNQKPDGSDVIIDHETFLERTLPDEMGHQADADIIDVDISKLSSQEVSELIENEESEWAQFADEEADAGLEENQDELHQEDISDDKDASLLS